MGNVERKKDGQEDWQREGERRKHDAERCERTITTMTMAGKAYNKFMMFFGSWLLLLIFYAIKCDYCVRTCII